MYLPHLEELLKYLFKDSISNVYKNINNLYRFSKVEFFFQIQSLVLKELMSWVSLILFGSLLNNLAPQ